MPIISKIPLKILYSTTDFFNLYRIPKRLYKCNIYSRYYQSSVTTATDIAAIPCSARYLISHCDIHYANS